MRGELALLLLISAVTGSAAEALAGSAACRSCHAAIYGTWSKTAMAVSSGAVNARQTDRASFTHAASASEYGVKADGGALTLAVRRGAAKAEMPLRWFVGSGAEARSYVLEVEGFLFQAPVAWYARDKRWDLAPGYSRYNQPFFTRPVLPGCLNCHSTGLRPRLNTQNGFDSPPFTEGGIGCERCHGSGVEHIATKGRGHIVNPAKLPPNRRDSVCAQCHLSGEVRVTKAGRSAVSFQPGERLADTFAVFVRGGQPAGMRVTSHVENLGESRCSKAAGNKLWCGTCHDPHSQPQVAERAAWYRQKCLSCHEGSKPCPVGMRTSDCVSCHMPRTGVSDAEHVVYTDHSIPRRPRTASIPAPSSNFALRLFDGNKPTPRDEGLAWAILASRYGLDTLRSRASALLGSIAAAGLNVDAEALTYLADLKDRAGKRNEAISLYERAIAIDPAQLTARVNLGVIRMEQQDYAGAVALWRAALLRNPGLPLVRTNLAVALAALGDRKGAEAVLAETALFSPLFVAPKLPTR